MPTFPAVVAVEGVTPVWLTAALRSRGRLADAEITHLDRAPCGTGQLGDSYRFTVTYSRPDAGPTSLIGKFASKDATSREFGRSSGFYRSEIGFYNELGTVLPVSAPTAIYAALDDNNTDFVLLMEDLAPARQVDQLAGCSFEDAARVMEQAAALHGASWNDARLAALPWMQGPVAVFTHFTQNFAKVIETFPQLCSDLVPAHDLAEAAKLVPLADRWLRVIRTPQCLWHCDLRADNVLFDAEDGRRPVVILDWQSHGFGPGTMDIALWMGTSLTVENRRRHERELVLRYHAALERHGVRDYSADRCWADYRMHAVQGLQVGIFGLGAVKRTDRGDRMWKTWIERTAEQVRDLDSFRCLQSRD